MLCVPDETGAVDKIYIIRSSTMKALIVDNTIPFPVRIRCI